MSSAVTFLQALAWVGIVAGMMFTLVLFAWWLDRAQARHAEKRRRNREGDK